MGTPWLSYVNCRKTSGFSFVNLRSYANPPSRSTTPTFSRPYLSPFSQRISRTGAPAAGVSSTARVNTISSAAAPWLATAHLTGYACSAIFCAALSQSSTISAGQYFDGTSVAIRVVGPPNIGNPVIVKTPAGRNPRGNNPTVVTTHLPAERVSGNCQSSARSSSPVSIWAIRDSSGSIALVPFSANDPGAI